MDREENHQQVDAFEAFKRAALYSLLWGCVGSFMLGAVVGSLLLR